MFFLISTMLLFFVTIVPTHGVFFGRMSILNWM